MDDLGVRPVNSIDSTRKDFETRSVLEYRLRDFHIINLCVGLIVCDKLTKVGVAAVSLGLDGTNCAALDAFLELAIKKVEDGDHKRFGPASVGHCYCAACSL